MKIAVIDNLSPFTPDILNCLNKLDIPYTCKKYSEVTFPDFALCDKVILSGRRKNNREINVKNSTIIRQCHGNKPLLGICYGAEIIALTLGGSIRKMPSHVQGSTQVSISNENPLTGDKKTVSVYESHGFCIAKLPMDFKSIAKSQYCEHEIFQSGSTYGTQFHPEKSGNDGLLILQNFALL